MEQLEFTYVKSTITEKNGSTKTINTRYLNGRQWTDADVWLYNRYNALLESARLKEEINTITEPKKPTRRKKAAVA